LLFVKRGLETSLQAGELKLAPTFDLALITGGMPCREGKEELREMQE
jgi:hypothetical protein